MKLYFFLVAVFILVVFLTLLQLWQEPINSITPLAVVKHLAIIHERTLLSKSHNTTPLINGIKDTIKIDIVHLLVNGSDPISFNVRSSIKNEAGAKESSSANRFREFRELFYSLKFLKKYVSNLGHVYVITSGELPSYKATFPWVIWINHSQFMPSSLLPTFSSKTIQFNLFRLLHILSDPFVTMDDDFFITQPLDLYEYAHSRIWYVEDGHKIGFSPVSKNSFMLSVQNTNALLKTVFPDQKSEYFMGHVPAVNRHATLIKVNSAFNLTFTMTPFRAKNSIQYQYMLAMVEKHTLTNITFVNASLVSQFIMMFDNRAENLKRFNTILKYPKQFLCVNDDFKRPILNYTLPDVEKFFRRLLENNSKPFPVKYGY